MTSVIIPSFIFQLFEKEITKINASIVDAICKKYSLDIQEVHQMLKADLNINFKIVSEDIEEVKIVKKHPVASSSKSIVSTPDVNPLTSNQENQDKQEKQEKQESKENKENQQKKKQPAETPQEGQNFCDARIFIPSSLTVKQCSKNKVSGCNFCKMHQRLYEEGKLKYGTVHETKPEAISTPALNLRVKRTIY